MTREEARVLLKNLNNQLTSAFYDGDFWVEEGTFEAFEVADAALRGPRPDPDTGLVPCGCGTPMLLMGDDETQYWVECGDSVHCPHFIGQAYDGAGIYQTPEEAIKAARVAMGWKGGAE